MHSRLRSSRVRGRRPTPACAATNQSARGAARRATHCFGDGRTQEAGSRARFVRRRKRLLRTRVADVVLGRKLPQAVGRPSRSTILTASSSFITASAARNGAPTDLPGWPHADAEDQFAIAGTATFTPLNAGITSRANHSNCSSASDSGTPTDRLTVTRSSPG